MSLIDNGHIIAQPSPPLDNIYKTYPANPPSASESTTTHEHSNSQELLLSPEAIPQVVTDFELKASAASDMKRAIEQCRIQINKQ